MSSIGPSSPHHPSGLNSRASMPGRPRSETDETIHSLAEAAIHYRDHSLGEVVIDLSETHLIAQVDVEFPKGRSRANSAPASPGRPEGAAAPSRSRASSLESAAERADRATHRVFAEKLSGSGETRRVEATKMDNVANVTIQVGADTAQGNLRFWTETKSGTPSVIDEFKETDAIFLKYKALRDKITLEGTEFTIDFTANTVCYYVKKGMDEVLETKDLDIEFQTHPDLKPIYEELKKEAFESARLDLFSCPITHAGVYSFLNGPKEITSISRAVSALGKNPLDNLEEEVTKLSFFQKLSPSDQTTRRKGITTHIERLRKAYAKLSKGITDRLREIQAKKNEEATKKDAVEKHRLAEQEKEIKALEKQILEFDFFAIGSALAAAAVSSTPNGNIGHKYGKYFHPPLIDDALAENVFRSIIDYGTDPKKQTWFEKMKDKIQGIVSGKTPQEKTEEYALKVIGLLSNFDPSCPRAYYLKACREQGVAPKAPVIEGALVKDIAEKTRDSSYEPTLDRWLSLFVQSPITGENKTKLEGTIKGLLD